MDPVEINAGTTQPNFVHFTDAFLRVLLLPTPQVPYFPSLVNIGIVMTTSMACGPVEIATNRNRPQPSVIIILGHRCIMNIIVSDPVALHAMLSW